MVNRSKEEVYVCAYLLACMGRPVGAAAILRCLREGAVHQLWDFILFSSDPSRTLFVDYDGGRYHGDDRLPYDAQKTREALRRYPGARVLRIRTKGAAVMATDVEGAFVVQGDDVVYRQSHTAMNRLARRVARSAREAFRWILDEAEMRAFDARLGHGVSKICANAAREAIAELFREEAKLERALVRTLGSTKASARLMAVNGVRKAALHPKFLAALAAAKADLVDGGVDKFVTLCGNNGFMSRVTEPEFLADVKALTLRYGIDAVMKLTSHQSGWFGLISRDRECLRALFDVMNDTEGRKQQRVRETCRKRKRAA